MTAVNERIATSSLSDDGDWQERGACRGAPPDVFFPGGDGEEPAYPPPEALGYCDRCPVRANCLSANLYEPFGVYGGLSGYLRALITRPRPRKRCPGCNSGDVVTEQQHEICLACGISWPII